jgi:uncharacterized protein (DUF2344 family)
VIKEITMDIIYKITYKPHLGTDKLKYYIGSKKRYDKNPSYLGSLSSQKIYDFTEGKTLCEWWKYMTKNNPNDFKFEILETFNDIDAKDLVKIEKQYHIKNNVLSEEYFNQSIATEGFVSTKNNDFTKKKKSIATKKYWDSEQSIEKRNRLIERNKTVHSKTMKERWSNPTSSMLNRKCSGRPKGCKDLKQRKQRPQKRICIDGVVYDNAKIASEKIGIHVVNIRRRCRLDKYKNWSYIE